MMLEDLSEVLDMFKGSFPLSLIFFIPILIILSPASPVSAAHEFAVYRMQQFDLQGSTFGSKNAAINVEARSVDAQVYTRKCILTKLTEFTIDKYKEMVNQNAAGVLILLPNKLDLLSLEEKEYFMQVEQDLLQEETLVPVYFAEESDTLLEINQDVKDSVNSDQAGSGAEALLGAASANGFQLVTSSVQSKAMVDFEIANIQGKLAGSGIEEQLPTIAIVAHYDAFGITPALAFGADSNASGVAALIELARLFSKLYTNSRTHAKFNLLFLLSGAGKLNFQGTKRWIDDQLETTENSLLPDVSYVLCLDSVGVGNSLYLHVSKPPKPGTEGGEFLQNLRQSSSQFFPESEFEMVHKKINLAEDFLAWEHERFSVRRLPAFTLSHLPSHTSNSQNTIFDTRATVDSSVIARNVKVTAEALARHMFNLSSDANFDIFTEGLKVEEESITAWLDYLTSEPRSAQLLTKDSPLVNSLEQAFSRYLKDVQKHTFTADKRDPEFVFYDLPETTMSAYNVKPAVFDLFLAIVIASYLGLLFLFIQNFGTVYVLLRKIGSPVKAKAP